MNNIGDTSKKTLLNKLLLLLFTLVFLASCSEKIVNPSNTYKYNIPEQIDDGWETADLKTVGIKKQPILDMIDEINKETYKNVHSILIVGHGKLVFEQYFEGEKFKLAQYTGEKGFDRDDLHNLCSATKSFTSACIGIAMDQGLIQSMNQKVFSFFPEYSDILASESEKNNLTLEHLLTMTSGIDWNDTESSYYDPQK